MGGVRIECDVALNAVRELRHMMEGENLVIAGECRVAKSFLFVLGPF